MKIKLFFYSLAVIISANVSAQKTDFSGNWLLNEQRSEFGGQPVATMFKQLTIKQTSDSLTIEGLRFNTEGTKTSNTITVYPLNGNIIETMMSNKRKMTASIIWSADSRTLTRNSSYSLPDNPEQEDYKSQEVWSLSDAGKILILARTFIRDGGEVMVKAVYDRQ